MAHADTESKNPPGRRLGCVVLVLDQDRRVLMVKPTYKHQHETLGWQLPGGHAHANEAINAAGSRELAEETGLDRVLTGFVMLDQVPRNDEKESAEGLNVVLLADPATAEEVRSAAVPESAADELAALRWVPLEHLDEHALPYQARRVRAAVAARDAGLVLPLYLLGEPVAA